MNKKLLGTSLVALTMLSGMAFAGEKLLIAPAPVSTDIVIAPAISSKMPFEDINSESDFYEDIQYVFDNGIMNGVATNEFAPKSTLTRAMMVTIIYRAEGEPAFMNDNVFKDVESGSYYEKAVVWAQGKGIVNGVSNTEFAPNANVTREQMATMLYRYANYKELGLEKATENTNTLSFDDIMDISEYAGPAVHCCLASGALLDNREELKILPKADATRDEAAHAIAVIKTFSATNELPTYEQLAGNYFDATSGRATLEATAQEDGLLINVNWANSAFECVEWTMLAKFGENDVLAYENCTRKLIGSDEKGNESEKVEYENGKGFFTISDGNLLWNGAEEENCRECIFELPTFEE